MKFAELVVKAGFPPGVVNILPGKGTVIILINVAHVKSTCCGLNVSAWQEN